MARPSAILSLVLVLAAVLGGVYWAVTGQGTDEVAAVEGFAPIGEEPLPAAQDDAASLSRPADPQAAQPEAVAADTPSAPRRAASNQRRASQAPPFEDPRWVRGRVVVPPGAPPESALEVVAIGRKKQEVHRAFVEPDLTFRIAFPPDTRRGRIDLAADYLYVEDPPRVRPKDFKGEVVLEGKIGGRLVGRLLPPSEGPTGQVDLDGIEVELTGGPNDSSGFAASMFGGALRSTVLDEEGRFVFGGLRPDYTFGIRCDPGAYAPLDEDGFDVEPKEEKVIELEFEPGTSVAGWVVDEGGAPVAGAVVRTNPPRDRRFFLGDKLETDEQGAFLVQGLKPGQIEVLAWKSGYLVGKTSVGELEIGDLRTGVSIELDPGEILRGRVLWPDGTPAAGAAVEFDEDFDSRGFGLFFDVARNDDTVETDADGRFEKSGLELGTYTLTVDATRGREEGESLRELLAKKGRKGTASKEGVNPQEGDVTLELRVGGRSIRGRVLTDDERVLTRFRVGAEPQGGNGDLLADLMSSFDRPFRSSDGTFVLDGLGDGTWEVRASAKGYKRSEAQVVTLPGQDRELVFHLKRLALARGVVRDSAGEPVAKAKVQAVSRAPGDDGELKRVGSDDAVTDEEGRFVLDELVPGRVEITADASDHAESEPFVADVIAEAELEGVELVLRGGGTLTGEVHAIVEEPAGRRVFVNGEGDWKTTSTDEDGRFELSGLTPGEYSVRLGPPRGENNQFFFGWGGGSIEVEAQIAEGLTTHVVVGAPDPDSLAVRGVVLRGGEPVDGCTVRVRAGSKARKEDNETDANTKTDVAGRFELLVEGPADYVFEVGREVDSSGFGFGRRRSQAETTFERDVPAGGLEDLQLELPGGRIAGTVRAAGGLAVGVMVQLDVSSAKDEDGRRTRDRYQRTDASGRYAFDDLLPGEYLVRAGGPERSWGSGPSAYGAEVSDELTLEDGGALEEVDFDLDEPGTIDCRVLGADGEPAGGVRLEVRDENGRELTARRYRTNIRGRVQFTSAPPGTFTVRVEEDDFSAEQSGVKVRSGEITSIELYLGS